MMINGYVQATNNILVWLVVLACFSIPLGTAFMSIFMGLFVLVWAISGDYVEKFERIRHHPAAWAAIALFLLYGFGMLYSSVEWDQRLAWWLKYHKLLYIPFIIAVLTTDKLRQFALNAFLAGMILVLCISYLKWFGILPVSDIGQGYIVFKSRIAHNIFMAFAAYLMLLRVMESNSYQRWLWLLLSAMAVLNTLFLVNGRSGQIILLILLIWFCWEIWGRKSIKWMITGAALAITIHYFNPQVPHSRLTEIEQEISDHNLHGTKTSSGERMEFYRNTLTLVIQHPLLGAGTGSFNQEYSQLAKAEKTSPTHNPHNEFLLTAQELGLVGFMALLIFWFAHWRASFALNQWQWGYAMRGLVITLFIGSMFNSLLLDSGEGKFYCVLAGVLLSAYVPSRKLSKP